MLVCLPEIKMTDTRLMLDKLSPRTRGQIVRVRIVDKQPRQESANKCSYQRMTLVDEKGNRMTATLFGIDISVYENILQRGNWYDITNLVVKEVPPRYALYTGELQLYFTNSTRVCSVTNVATSSRVIDPYTCINAIPRDASKDDRFDVIAILLWVHPEKLVSRGDIVMPVREISVTDDSGDNVLIISAWNRTIMAEFEKLEHLLVQDPVIEFKGLKISNFAGFSLAASMSTEVKVHSATTKAVALREWYDSHKEEIDARALRAINSEIPGYPTEVSTVAEALVMTFNEIVDPHFLRLRVHVPEICYDDLRISFGCRICGKVCADPAIQFHQEYHCETCAVTRTAELKIYFRFRCTDGSGTMTLDAYTRNAEKLLKVKSEDLYAMTLPERKAFVDRAQLNFCIGYAQILITPVKSLLVSHKVIKWYLKDVLG